MESLIIKQGETMLMVAARFGQPVSVVEYLVEKGANPRLRHKVGYR